MVFTIGELAEDYGVSEQSLRRWEAAGLIPQASRKHIARWRVWDYDDAQKIGKFVQARRCENEVRSTG